MSQFELKLYKVEVMRGYKMAVHYILAPAHMPKSEVETEIKRGMPTATSVNVAIEVASSIKENLNAVGF